MVVKRTGKKKKRIVIHLMYMKISKKSFVVIKVDAAESEHLVEV